MRNLIRSERGTSLVEFALVAPVLILLVVGIVEIGRYMYFGILAAHAAEAGATYGAQNLHTAQDATGMQYAALADAANLSEWSATAKYQCMQTAENGASEMNCASGTPSPETVYYVVVKVSGTFKPLLHYPGVSSSVPVTATTTMRVQNQ